MTDYMWTGGNNYGRWTGDAITHMYAVDAIVCPDGLPHEPKFSHSSAMHAAIASVAGTIAHSPAQLGKGSPMGKDKKVTAFKYDSTDLKEAAIFLENTGKEDETVTLGKTDFHVPAGSTTLVRCKDSTDCVQLFNSATAGAAPAKHRELKKIKMEGSWSKWAEPVLFSDLKPGEAPAASVFKSSEPMDSALQLMLSLFMDVPIFMCLNLLLKEGTRDYSDEPHALPWR